MNMICLVDMEHEEVAQRDAPYAKSDSGTCFVPQQYLIEVRQRLEEISHQRCVIRQYTDVTQRWLDDAGIRSLILSGNITAWDRYDRASMRPLMAIVRTASLPILGLCGGLQLIALAHGADVGPIRELEGGEQDVQAGLGGGTFKEWGFKPVRVVRSDPLFSGLEAPVFLEAHYWEVKEVPAGFELLASTETCRIQALRRTGTLVYGTQFHPEAYVVHPSHRDNWLMHLVYPDHDYTQEQPDGRRLLVNFFRQASFSSG